MSEDLGIAFSLICMDVANKQFESGVRAEVLNLRAEEIAGIYMEAAKRVKDGNAVGIYHIKVEG